MDIWIAVIILIIVFAVGVWWLSVKLSNPENKEEKEKMEKALFQLENLQKILNDNRKETSDNLKESSKNVQDRLDKTIDFLTKQLNEVNKSVDTKLSDNTRVLGERLDNAAKVIGAVKGELGKMQELGPHIQNLAKIFHSPKLRGGMGEKILEEVLSQRLPNDMWKMQYTFKNGEAVDAVIFTKSGIVPIDAKFPLDNFRKLINAETESEKITAHKEFEKDVKKQINDIAKKYIRPDEKTTPFAIMYLPAEDIYYEAAIRSEDLTDYAASKNVTMVSPNIFYHFLGIVLLSLQSQKIEEKAGKVLELIKGVKTESVKFGENLSVLERHIENSSKKMGDVSNGFGKLSGKIDSVAEFGNQISLAKESEKLPEKTQEELFEE